jgi:hypothetical protein
VKLKGEALPGSRDGVLEDAFMVACATRAVIEFTFNLEIVEMEAFYTPLGFRGFARFYDRRGKITARFERRETHIHGQPKWWGVPADGADPAQDASPEAK